MMKLYTVPLAPNPTKVMLYLAEREVLGAEFPIEQITVNTLKGRHKEPEYLRHNPFGTLPTLELEDGTHILESLAIMEYLEDRFPDYALHPQEPEQRALARDIERIAEVRVAMPVGIFVHAENSPIGYPKDPEKAAAALARMASALDYLENLLSDGRPLLTGEQVAIADCTLQAALQFVRFIKADILGDRGKLRAWDKRYRQRPAAKTVLRW